MSKAPELHIKDHDHHYEASPCEEGCECNYIHLSCKDEGCDFMAMADGWLGVNVDWIWHIEEDSPEELKALKEKYDWRKQTTTLNENSRGGEEDERHVDRDGPG